MPPEVCECCYFYSVRKTGGSSQRGLEELQASDLDPHGQVRFRRRRKQGERNSAPCLRQNRMPYAPAASCRRWFVLGKWASLPQTHSSFVQEEGAILFQLFPPPQLHFKVASQLVSDAQQVFFYICHVSTNTNTNRRDCLAPLPNSGCFKTL